MNEELLRQRRDGWQEPQIVSSKEDVITLDQAQKANTLLRKARATRFTITSTFTSFSFVTVNATKVVSVGSNLLCLPGGFVICK